MRKLPLIALGILITVGISSAQVNGTVWESTTDASNADDSANNEASTLPNATFTSTGINYNSNTTGYTVGTFLNNPTFSNENNSFDPTLTADNIEVQFVGTIYLTAGANNFTVEHDDGLNLSVAGIGTVLDEPDSTAAVSTPITINAPTTGDYTFTINYAECCGAPAVLEFSFPSGAPVGSTPEPASIVLFGTLLGGFALFSRRRMRA